VCDRRLNHNNIPTVPWARRIFPVSHALSIMHSTLQRSSRTLSPATLTVSLKDALCTQVATPSASAWETPHRGA
jgi:hypothetical protein